MSKEIFNIEDRYSNDIKFSSANHEEFEGTSKNDFILFLIKKNFNLSGSDLSGSDLSGSNLSGLNLRGSNLSESNLRGSNLRGSNLRESNLRESDLRGSNLSESDLRGSNLSGSDLSGSDLSGSNLSGLNLRGSDLSGSDLSGSKIPIYSYWNISIIALIPSPKLIIDYEIKIGCKQKSIEDWDIWFSSTDIFNTPRNTEDFIRIEANYKATKAYLIHLCDELAKLESKV